MPFTAIYDLSQREASFDFFTWMTHVRLLGANEIVFNSSAFIQGGWTEEERKERFRTIVEPGPALAGLPCREGTDGEHVGSHRLGEVAAFNRPDFDRLRSILPPRKHRFTVTLRNTKHKKFRNSDHQVWRAFAAKIGAHVIPDYLDKPITLYERMAVYAGAEMNFGVTNGPLAVLFFSAYPFQMWDCNRHPESWERHGIPVGSQLPWSMKGQSLVWETPTVDGLMRSFEALKCS